MPVLDLSGERFRVETSGAPDAPALLLCHSLATDHTLWERVEPYFARHFRVIRYDARGHGASVAPDQVYSLGDLGRDALAILDRLEIGRAHVCGLSLGGMVGQWLALNAPHRVDRLVLANTTAHAGPARLWDGRIRAVRRHGMEPIAEAVVENWASSGFSAAAPQELVRLRASVAATPSAGYLGTACAMRDMDFRTDLARIGAPTLVIVSQEDRATPPDWGLALHASIPGAQLARLPGGHLSALEQPEAFAEAVTAFLR